MTKKRLFPVAENRPYSMVWWERQISGLPDNTYCDCAHFSNNTNLNTYLRMTDRKCHNSLLTHLFQTSFVIFEHVMITLYLTLAWYSSLNTSLWNLLDFRCRKYSIPPRHEDDYGHIFRMLALTWHRGSVSLDIPVYPLHNRSTKIYSTVCGNRFSTCTLPTHCVHYHAQETQTHYGCSPQMHNNPPPST